MAVLYCIPASVPRTAVVDIGSCCAILAPNFLAAGERRIVVSETVGIIRDSISVKRDGKGSTDVSVKITCGFCVKIMV